MYTEQTMQKFKQDCPSTSYDCPVPVLRASVDRLTLLDAH